MVHGTLHRQVRPFLAGAPPSGLGWGWADVTAYLSLTPARLGTALQKVEREQLSPSERDREDASGDAKRKKQRHMADKAMLAD